MEPNVRWSGAYKDALPDSHFFYVDRACVRRTDSDGRSHPLSCRHFPYKDQQGNISLSHVRNAISRAPQSHLPAHVQRDVQRKARALLQHQDRMAANGDDLYRDADRFFDKSFRQGTSDFKKTISPGDVLELRAHYPRDSEQWTRLTDLHEEMGSVLAGWDKPRVMRYLQRESLKANTQQRFPGFGAALEVTIPHMPRYKQIGGDMDPGKYGGLVARSDGDNALELFEIQPVREFVGDDEAADVGFPFWSKEAYYDLDDLRFDRDEVQHALQSVGLEEHELEAMTPDQRALAIAEALFRYGDKVEEAASGWSNDVVTEEIEWMRGDVAGADYIADEDDEFRREILGEDEDEDDELEPNARRQRIPRKASLSLGPIEETKPRWRGDTGTFAHADILLNGEKIGSVHQSGYNPRWAYEINNFRWRWLNDPEFGPKLHRQPHHTGINVYLHDGAAWDSPEEALAHAQNKINLFYKELRQLRPNSSRYDDGPCVIFCDTAGRGYYTGSVRMVPHYSPQAMDAKVFADKTAASRVITSHGSMGGCHIYLLKPDDPNYPNPVPPRTPFTENSSAGVPSGTYVVTRDFRVADGLYRKGQELEVRQGKFYEPGFRTGHPLRGAEQRFLSNTERLATRNGEGLRRSRGISATTPNLTPGSALNSTLDESIYQLALEGTADDDIVGAGGKRGLIFRDGFDLANQLHAENLVDMDSIRWLEMKGPVGVIIVVDNNEAQVVYYDSQSELRADWSELETKLAGFEPNASSADRRRFEQLRASYIKAEEAYQEAEIKLGSRWGHSKNWKTYLKAADRKRLERLAAAKERAKDKFFELVQRISPRDWTYGVPSHWVVEKLPYEDAVRPANEPLSVEPPVAFGATASRT